MSQTPCAECLDARDICALSSFFAFVEQIKTAQNPSDLQLPSAWKGSSSSCVHGEWGCSFAMSSTRWWFWGLPLRAAEPTTSASGKARMKKHLEPVSQREGGMKERAEAASTGMATCS